ncbi:MAG: N-acetylmuramoyl-L-alanine amidase-like domain-containing protein [Myxococcota bacterium]
MAQLQLSDADPVAVQACLDAVAQLPALPDRLERLSAGFLGRPYLSFPLIGGPDTPEQLVGRLDAFDCVTFAETVLALGWSRVADDYPRILAAIRYRAGSVRWMDRNHYMTVWIRRNVRAGFVARVKPDAWVWGADEPRSLSILPRYPAVAWRPRWFPSDRLDLLATEARAGDVVCFASNKPNLDTYHVGVLIPARPLGAGIPARPLGAGIPGTDPADPSAGALAVRHASRSKAMVVHQPLSEYLASDDVPGMLVVRPSPTPPRTPRGAP